MKLQEVIHERIFTVQKRNGWKDSQLSAFSGVPKSTLCTLKKNRGQLPSLLVIGKIAEAYNMSLAEFFDCELFEVNGELVEYEY